MIVWVAGFHPSVAGGDTGGFEWRYSRADARRELLDFLLDEHHERHNLVFAAIEVPFEVNPARPREYDDREHEITQWIDANLHLIELPLQHEAVA